MNEWREWAGEGLSGLRLRTRTVRTTKDHHSHPLGRNSCEGSEHQRYTYIKEIHTKVNKETFLKPVLKMKYTNNLASYLIIINT